LQSRALLLASIEYADGRHAAPGHAGGVGIRRPARERIMKRRGGEPGLALADLPSAAAAYGRRPPDGAWAGCIHDA
jgi:hypothetical protein